jgi:hypothetical protein
MMTVGELIEKLKKHSQDELVVLSDGGFGYVYPINAIERCRYLPCTEDSGILLKDDNNPREFPCVVLVRREQLTRPDPSHPIQEQQP